MAVFFWPSSSCEGSKENLFSILTIGIMFMSTCHPIPFHLAIWRAKHFYTARSRCSGYHATISHQIRFLMSIAACIVRWRSQFGSPQLTNDMYTNVDPVLRQAVSLLPVSDWL